MPRFRINKFKLFALSFLILLLYALPGLAGQRYVFQTSTLWNQDVFYYSVMSFEQGDEVIIADGSETLHSFKLGKFLGQGTAGRVFAIEGSLTPQVIKFQFGIDRAREMMKEELNAFRIFKRVQIPHAKVISADERFYIVKDGIPGNTLTEVVDETWEHLKSQKKKTMIFAMRDLFKSLNESSWSFDDLSGDNVIFDEVQQVWKVIDSGVAKRLGSASGSVENLETCIEFNSEMKKMLDWARAGRGRATWIEPYLSLVHARELLETGTVPGGQIRARSRFFCGVVKSTPRLVKCPKAVFKEWVKAVSRLAEIGDSTVNQALMRQIRRNHSPDISPARARVLNKLSQKVLRCFSRVPLDQSGASTLLQELET